MRIIKFRIWNNKTKEWIHGPNPRPDLDGCNLFGECILLGAFLDKVSIQDLNEIEALQYTGIKDKNGREIFEGDIIQFNSYTNDSYGQNYKGIVRYSEDTAGFRLVENLEDSNFLYKDEEHYYTVIGNIYDNPELTK